jgi:hypothetical protein
VACHALGDDVVVFDDENLGHPVNHATSPGCRRVNDW